MGNNQTQQIGVAVVGAGYWGPNLIRNFTTLENSRLVAVCDLDPMRLAAISARYPDVKTTNQLKEVLSDSSIDAIIVATPAETHFEIIQRALRAGKHVYSEKPLTANSHDAAQLVQTEIETGLILMVGHLFLFDAAVNQLINSVRSGGVGDIRYLHGIRTSMAGTARLDTNIIWDALIHDAYILPAIFGYPPKRVMAIGAGYLSPGLEDVSFVTFDFGEGRLAQIYVSWYALEKARRMTIVGSSHVLVYDDLAESKLMLYARRYEQGEELDPKGRRRWHWHEDGVRNIDIEKNEPLRAECQHFINCVIEGKQPLSGSRAGLEAVRILEACQRSLRSNNTWEGVI